MKATEVINHVLDILDRDEPAQVNVTITKTPDAENTISDTEAIERMKQIAGLMGNKDGDYANSPEEKYATVNDVMSHGGDVHKPKHPADIRTNAPSMYPNFQAKE